jgi:hypothetical protein
MTRTTIKRSSAFKSNYKRECKTYSQNTIDGLLGAVFVYLLFSFSIIKALIIQGQDEIDFVMLGLFSVVRFLGTSIIFNKRIAVSCRPRDAAPNESGCFRHGHLEFQRKNYGLTNSQLVGGLSFF